MDSVKRKKLKLQSKIKTNFSGLRNTFSGIYFVKKKNFDPTVSYIWSDQKFCPNQPFLAMRSQGRTLHLSRWDVSLVIVDFSQAEVLINQSAAWFQSGSWLINQAAARFYHGGCLINQAAAWFWSGSGLINQVTAWFWSGSSLINQAAAWFWSGSNLTVHAPAGFWSGSGLTNQAAAWFSYYLIFPV